MKCKDVYLHICDNLEADPNSAECRRVLKHLSSCPDCAAFLDSVKRTVTLYRTTPSPRVPSRAHKQLFKAIDLVWKGKSKPAHKGHR